MTEMKEKKLLDEADDPRFQLTSIERYLVDQKLIDLQTLRFYQKRAFERGAKVEDELLESGAVKEGDILFFKAGQLKIEYIDLEELQVDPSVVVLIGQDYALENWVFPIEKNNRELKVAMVDPKDVKVREEMRAKTGCTITPLLSTKSSIEHKVFEYRNHYRKKLIDELLATVGDTGIKLTRELGIEIGSIKEIKEQAPVVKTVNLLILQALQTRASDIHIIPKSKDVKIKFRIDGILQEMAPLPLEYAETVVSRIKIMCELDISEKRMPQDGHFKIIIEGQEIDFRVVVTPTIHGEKAVLRVLDRSTVILDMKYLGFTMETINKFRRQIEKPYGIIIMTGPTGSGKTTTLYSAMKLLNFKEKNITTVENPIEYHMSEITQIQVHPEIGLTFAHSLRSILRQDPDIILIGEIRDLETAQIATTASQTGHLVFATLHTNDAAGAITRLLDIGIEPYLLASTLQCVLSQRLVRRICPHCRKEYIPEEEYLNAFNVELPDDVTTLAYGVGCMHCYNSGFIGRIAIGELLDVKDNLRELIMGRANTQIIRDKSIENGMIPIKQDALQKVFQKITTLEEIFSQVGHES
jgi:type II secretory ATPase GspE/PulE/Tfp pilus assembly ATPase PilB-like protein